MSSARAEPLRDEGTRGQVIFAGAIAGLVSRFIIAPLDVLKIRLQLQYHSLADPLSTPLPHHHHRPSPSGVLTVARSILRHEGLAGFWKGNIPAEGLYLSYGAVQFLTYRTTTQALDVLFARPTENDPISPSPSYLPGAAKSFLAGAVAGCAATTATYPLDLLRTRFAAQGTRRVYAGLVASVRDITRHEGATGFFRGLSAGISQIVPYMGIFFTLYEGLKAPLSGSGGGGGEEGRQQGRLPWGSGDAVAGTLASVLAKTAVFPLDTVRKRLQVQGPTRGRYIGGERMPVYERGVVRTLGMIWRKEGRRGLYRGLTVSLVKAAPASAVTMWTYERVMMAIKD